MRGIYLVIVIMSLGYTFVCAQPIVDTTSSTYKLKMVDINANRLQFVPEINVEKFDEKLIKERASGGMQSLLSDYANVNIRSYGYSGLANVGMRGVNSNQTAVLWNGFNLQDPLNGGTNLLLFPLFFIDEVSVQKGGEAALFGSGAMGGTIGLHNNMKFNSGLSTGFVSSVGSFSNYMMGASAKVSKSNYVFLIKAFYKEGENDFPYTNTEQLGKPDLKQENAAMKQYGLLQENSFKIAKRQLLNTHFWYQKTDHQLPPNMAQLNSQKNQLDESMRGSIDWNYYHANWKLTLRNGTFYSSMLYTDPDTDESAKHQSLSNISEAEANVKLRAKKDLFNIGMNYTYEKGISQLFQGDQTRNRMAVFLSYKWQLHKKIALSGSGRKEYVDSDFTPFTYALKLAIKDLGKFRLFAQYSKNYRIPTFNDLYWYDGLAQGNPDLKDESSWNMEIGSSFSTKIKRSKLFLKGSVFNSVYTNLIQWVPVQGLWMPMNQKEVWARGLEAGVKYEYSHDYYSIKAGVNYSLIYSTLEEKNDSDPESILHNQLILTPVNQGSGRVRLGYKSIGFEYIQEFIGKQYITADHTDEMNAYSIGNIVLYWEKQINKFPLNLMFRWNNIWNTVYQSMPGYAMPKANYELSLQLYFNQKKK